MAQDITIEEGQSRIGTKWQSISIDGEIIEKTIVEWQPQGYGRWVTDPNVDDGCTTIVKAGEIEHTIAADARRVASRILGRERANCRKLEATIAQVISQSVIVGGPEKLQRIPGGGPLADNLI